MEATGMESSKIQLNKQILNYGELSPKIDSTVYIAPGALIIGDVTIGKDSSVWYNTVVRGDVNYITIGEQTNIQDGTVIHVTNGKFPTHIGSKVTIGHLACLHGCTIHDLCLIGMNATVLDGAIVEERSMVAAGTLVRQGFTVPSGKLVAGVPGKVIRDLTKEELEFLEISAQNYLGYAEKTRNSIS